MNRLLYVVPYVIALGIFLIVFLVYDHNADKAIEKAKIDFPLLTREQSLSERVKKIFCPPEVRCSTPPILVVLVSGEQKSIDVKESSDSTIISLIDVFSVGDSLVKKANDDTVFVYHNRAVSSFLIH